MKPSTFHKPYLVVVTIAVIAAAGIAVFLWMRCPRSETDLVDAAIRQFRAQGHTPGYDPAVETQAVDAAAALFGPFMVHESLSREQRHRLRPLVTRRIYLIDKYNADLRGLKADDPRRTELHRRFTDAQRQVSAGIRQVLTPQQHADFEAHSETVGWREFLGPYLRKLEASHLGLKWAEEIQLLQALRAATSEPLREGERGKPRPAVLQARLEKAARQVLNPERYDRLAEYLEPMAYRYSPQMPQE